MQVIVALREDLSLKREASIELSRKSISVTLSGVAVLCGDLAHDVDGEGSDWLVEDELPGFDGARFLVFDLRKRESFVDWPAPLAADCGGGGTDRTLLIGGKGEAQKRATARQCATARPTPRRTALCSAAAADAPTNPCPPNPAAPPPPPRPAAAPPQEPLPNVRGRLASYQVLQKLPSNVRCDVYARAPRGIAGVVEEEVGEMMLHFVGKVVAEGSAEAPAAATQAAALAAQEVRTRSLVRSRATPSPSPHPRAAALGPLPPAPSPAASRSPGARQGARAPAQARDLRDAARRADGAVARPRQLRDGGRAEHRLDAPVGSPSTQV